MENAFIFDLDDTLIYTEYRYNMAKANAVSFISSIIGRKNSSIRNILDKIEEIDRCALKSWERPYAIERFPQSIARAMMQICSEKNVEYRKEDVEEIARIGMSAFQTSPEDIMPGVEDTLDFLVENGDKMMLITKGDFEFQMEKVNANGLHKWFKNSNILVVQQDKSPEVILEMLRSHGCMDNEHSYSVGNYYRSDIEPAIEAGIKAVYIPNGSWAHEVVENSIEKARQTKRAVVLDSIIEIKNKYSELFA